MMLQPSSISSRKNRSKKPNNHLAKNKLEINTSPSNIPRVIKTNTLSLINFLRLGFILILWHKVLHLFLRSARGIKNSTVGQFRMVSEDYRGETSTSGALGETKKSSPALQPTRLVLDDETVQKYKKKLEGFTDEDRLAEFHKEKSLGNECFKRSQYETAVQHYTRCILSQPDSVVGYSNRAAALLKMNKYTQALEDCNEALKIDPGHAKAKYRRGMALHHKNYFREALQDFEDVVRGEPNNFLANHFIGKIRELLYTHPRDIRLRPPAPDTPLIHISEKEYRLSPGKYARCVPVTEWGHRKAYCSCLFGQPEFIRAYRKDSGKFGGGGNFKRHYRSQPADSTDAEDSLLRGSSVKPPVPDASVSILAKGFMRSLSGGKEKISAADQAESSAATGGTSSILESTLKSAKSVESTADRSIVAGDSAAGHSIVGDLRSQTTVESFDPFDPPPHVPLIRDMPLLGDEEMTSLVETALSVPSTESTVSVPNSETTVCAPSSETIVCPPSTQTTGSLTSTETAGALTSAETTGSVPSVQPAEPRRIITRRTTKSLPRHCANTKSSEPTEFNAPNTLKHVDNDKAENEFVETRSELSNVEELVCGAVDTNGEPSSRSLESSLSADADPKPDRTKLRPRKSKNTERPIRNVNQIDNKQSEPDNPIESKQSESKLYNQSTRFDESTFKTIELDNQIDNKPELVNHCSANGKTEAISDPTETSISFPDVPKVSPWTGPNTHPVACQASNVSLAQIGILPSEHKLKSVSLVREAMAQKIQERPSTEDAENSIKGTTQTKVSKTAELTEELDSLEELAKGLQKQASELEDSKDLAVDLQDLAKLADELKSSNTSSNHINISKSTINNNVSEFNANYQKPARKNAKVIDAKGNIAKIPNDLKSSTNGTSSDTTNQNSVKHNKQNITTKQNGTKEIISTKQNSNNKQINSTCKETSTNIQSNSTTGTGTCENSTSVRNNTKETSTMSHLMNGDHIMDEAAQVVVNGSSAGGDSAPVKTLTKASKRHMRRKNFKLKQNQESTESVPCKL